MRACAVVGDCEDIHVREVCARLAAHGILCAEINLTGPGRYSAEFSNDGDWHVNLPVLGGPGCIKTTLSECVVWWRNKSRADWLRSEADQIAAYTWKERQSFAKSLWVCARAHFNSPAAAHDYAQKPPQMKIALESGFDLPRTLITSDREEALAFVSSVESAICKPLNLSLLPPTEPGKTDYVTMMTNRVTKSEILAASAEQFEAAPIIFQEEVVKDHELRVIAVGNRVVTLKVDSQSDIRTQVDWRRDQARDMFQIVDLGDRARPFLKFLQRAGLFYGVFDAAVDREGRLLFLECNIDGQWAWFKESIVTTIADAFAEQILECYFTQRDVVRTDAAPPLAG
jgi:hypothetical protein